MCLWKFCSDKCVPHIYVLVSTTFKGGGAHYYMMVGNLGITFIKQFLSGWREGFSPLLLPSLYNCKIYFEIM
jgi:hypothetical protein